MREVTGDLWDYLTVGSVIGITTNNVVNKDGRNIMGKGIAKQARDKFPGIDSRIGAALRIYGPRTLMFQMGMQVGNASEWTLVTIPTKHHWREQSDPNLIVQSCEQLDELTNKYEWNEVHLTRPGCGSGGLRWLDVKPLIDDILDDRFVVVDHALASDLQRTFDEVMAEPGTREALQYLADH